VRCVPVKSMGFSAVKAVRRPSTVKAACTSASGWYGRTGRRTRRDPAIRGRVHAESAGATGAGVVRGACRRM
jgi:hypothetical protein